jgi:hypothetical protein
MTSGLINKEKNLSKNSWANTFKIISKSLPNKDELQKKDNIFFYISIF